MLHVAVAFWVPFLEFDDESVVCDVCVVKADVAAPARCRCLGNVHDGSMRVVIDTVHCCGVLRKAYGRDAQNPVLLAEGHFQWFTEGRTGAIVDDL